MGYSTYFEGVFELNRKLTVSELETMSTLADWGEDDPEDAPGSECQWVIDEIDNQQILRHDYEEKFNDWDEWLQYLAKQFESWGVKMNGSVVWQGEGTGDCGMIYVNDNEVRFVPIREMPEPPESHWDNDPEFPPEDWQAEVANGETRQSYHEWVSSKREQDGGDDG